MGFCGGAARARRLRTPPAPRASAVRRRRVRPMKVMRDLRGHGGISPGQATAVLTDGADDGVCGSSPLTQAMSGLSTSLHYDPFTVALHGAMMPHPPRAVHRTMVRGPLPALNREGNGDRALPPASPLRPSGGEGQGEVGSRKPEGSCARIQLVAQARRFAGAKSRVAQVRRLASAHRPYPSANHERPSFEGSGNASERD